MSSEAIIALAVATFAGALVQAATGFGFAILAAPVFLTVTNSKSAIAMLIALHLLQSLMIVPAVAARASRWHLKRLMAGAVPGTVGGVLLFDAASVATLKVLAGVTILAVLALIALRAQIVTGRMAMQGGSRRGKLTLPIVGGLSAAMTVLLVMPGPPLMAYFLRERQAGEAVRAISLTFFATCYAALTIYHAITGSYGEIEGLTVAWLAPAVIAGTIAGSALMPQFSDAAFRTAIFILLLLSGIGALVSARTG